MLFETVKLYLSKYRDDEKGVTTVEYAIMLALVAVAVALATPGISDAVTSVFDEAATAFLNAYDTSEEKKAELLYYGAVACMAADQHEKALAVFDRLMAAHSSEMKLEWKESLVHVYLALDVPRKALPFIKELAEKTTHARRRQWQEVLLHQYVNLNMAHQALLYARQLTREYPVDPKWWKALAHLHLSESRNEAGLVALTVYGLLTPLTDEEKKLMAELSAAVGVPARAAKFYEDILSKTTDTSLVKRIAETYRMQDVDQPRAVVERLRACSCNEAEAIGRALSQIRAATASDSKLSEREMLSLYINLWKPVRDAIHAAGKRTL